MAKIKVDDPSAIKTLRELTGAKNLFPFADYDINDPKVYIGIVLYKEHEDNPQLKSSSGEFVETAEIKLPPDVRKVIFNTLVKINPDEELVKKLKDLGIEIVFPDENRRGGFWSGK